MSDDYDGWVDLDAGKNVAASLVAGVLALFFGCLYAHQVLSVDTRRSAYPETNRIADLIATGADEFLRAEYKVLAVFVTVVFIILTAAITWQTGVCFIVGAMLSALTGYLGMKIATKANIRTTLACSNQRGNEEEMKTMTERSEPMDMKSAFERLNRGLKVAFKSGAVMALSVVASGLIGLSFMYLIFNDEAGDVEWAWERLSGFAFGASSIALFARVGGGIYTKAADVGADLVGKVEEDLDEDSPDNPATIADNVGDNVGDVAGMGADLFESFVGSIIAAATLGTDYGNAGIALPFWVAGLGAIASIIGTLLIRATAPNVDAEEERIFQQGPKLLDRSLQMSDTEIDEVLQTVNRAWTNEKQVVELERISTLIAPEARRKALGDLIALEMNTLILEQLLGSIRFAIYGTSILVIGTSIISVMICFGNTNTAWNLFGCIMIGLVTGNLIGYFTEYFTSYTYEPTVSIAEKSSTGPATVIIQGLGVGMISAIPPVIFIVAATLGAYYFAGVYGIAIAAVGMLSTLGVTLATDAYGPVADNAGGIAEMSPDEIDEQTRETTDALDALGNTTAATGKGFAIGSAVLTALALMQAFAEAADLQDNEITLLDPVMLPGIFIGALLPFVFASLTMLSVGKAAESIIWECRKQLNDKEEGIPLDPQQCVKISTISSLKEMVVPGTLAVFVPMIVGTMLGSRGLLGMLAGAISAGFLLAVTMANAGGAWDNAKKFVEKGGLGPGKGKKTLNHKATVVGDTVGDPFKDTSGPALNILIKLMSIVSLVMAPALDTEAFKGTRWWVGVLIAVVLLILGFLFFFFTDKFLSFHDTDDIEEKAGRRKKNSGRGASVALDTRFNAPGLTGNVKYVGDLPNIEGTWVGVVLDESHGGDTPLLRPSTDTVNQMTSLVNADPGRVVFFPQSDFSMLAESDSKSNDSTDGINVAVHNNEPTDQTDQWLQQEAARFNQ